MIFTEIDISNDPLTGLIRKVVFTNIALYLDKNEMIITFEVRSFKDAELIPGERLPHYSRNLIINNSTPVDVSGNYVESIENENFFMLEYDYIKYVIENAPENIPSLIIQGALRADFLKRFD